MTTAVITAAAIATYPVAFLVGLAAVQAIAWGVRAAYRTGRTLAGRGDTL